MKRRMICFITAAMMVLFLMPGLAFALGDHADVETDEDFIDAVENPETNSITVLANADISVTKKLDIDGISITITPDSSLVFEADCTLTNCPITVSPGGALSINSEASVDFFGVNAKIENKGEMTVGIDSTLYIDDNAEFWNEESLDIYGTLRVGNRNGQIYSPFLEGNHGYLSVYGTGVLDIQGKHDIDANSFSWQTNCKLDYHTCDRLAGDDRFKTMESIVDRGFGTFGASTVIIATAFNYPDALAASGLAGALSVDGIAGGYVPILLTNPDVLSDEVIAALAKLKPADVVIVGGEGAVSKEVESSINMCLKVINPDALIADRVDGDDRIDTALKMYTKYPYLEWSDTAIIATGFSFADALSISSYAYTYKMPIFLTDSNGNLNDATKDLLESEFTNAIIVGGEGVVSMQTKDYLTTIFLNEIDRLAGENRYETSTEIAKYLTDNDLLSYNHMAVATGDNFPDALAGGAFCGLPHAGLSGGSVLLLVNDSTAGNKAIDDTIGYSNGYYAVADNIQHLYILGGTGVVSTTIETKIRGLLAEG